MNHEYLFGESGQSSMDQLKIGGSGAEPPEKILIFSEWKTWNLQHFTIKKMWGFGGGAPEKIFGDLEEMYLREKIKIRGREGESYSHNLGKWLLSLEVYFVSNFILKYT